MIRTNLLRHVPQSDQPDDSEEPTGFRWKTIPQGTATQCFVATHPTLSGVTGYYFADCNVAYPSEHMQDDAMAKKLWQVSLDLTADYRA